MIKRIAILGAIFFIGAFVQTQTGWFKSLLSNDIKVYSDPFWFNVTRLDTTINYQAEGERFIECKHRAPLTADLMDDRGNVISRELVRRSQPPEDRKSARVSPSSDSTIIGVPNVAVEPRKFRADNYIIVSDAVTLQEATKFTMRAECLNKTYGRLTGFFGPFPIPGDGETLAKFPDAQVTNRP